MGRFLPGGELSSQRKRPLPLGVILPDSCQAFRPLFSKTPHVAEDGIGRVRRRLPAAGISSRECFAGKFGWPDGEILGTITLLMKKHFDAWSMIVIVLTLILFAVALVKKGFTHDLLLEAGVFLVSAKLVLMSYKLSVTMVNLQQRMNEILDAMRQREKTVDDNARS
jgi:hypothetical protein